MYEVALALSIISSLLIIIYLIGVIFRNPKKDEDVTITIAGRVVTRTFNQTNSNEAVHGVRSESSTEGRVVDGQTIDAKALQSKISDIVRNVR